MDAYPTEVEQHTGLTLQYLQAMNLNSQSSNLSTEIYHPYLNTSLLNAPFIPLESDFSVYSRDTSLDPDYSIYPQDTARSELHARIQILSEEQISHLLEYIRSQEQPDFNLLPSELPMDLPEWFNEAEFLSFCEAPFNNSLAPMTTNLPLDSIALPSTLLAPGTNDTMTCCQCACTSALSRVDSGCGQCGHECESCLICPATLGMDHELVCCSCGGQGFELVRDGKKECRACRHGDCEVCYESTMEGGNVGL
jgi:hypothetical protein